VGAGGPWLTCLRTCGRHIAARGSSLGRGDRRAGESVRAWKPASVRLARRRRNRDNANANVFLFSVDPFCRTREGEDRDESRARRECVVRTILRVSLFLESCILRGIAEWRRYPWRMPRCRIRDTPTPAATASRNAGEHHPHFFKSVFAPREILTGGKLGRIRRPCRIFPTDL